MSEMFALADATLKVIQDRRSIREFTAEPVSDQDLDMILEAARQAPSGENAQPWRFVIVKDAATRQQMGAIAGGQRAPVHRRVRHQEDAGALLRPCRTRRRRRPPSRS